MTVDKSNMIDYDFAAATYDNTRTYADEVIDAFCRGMSLTSGTSVLDFGCGTGNYVHRIHARFGCQCAGVEPSDSMRARAIRKSPGLQFVKGDHRSIPFSKGIFDFSYMTDVIHHIPDRHSMFLELGRVLKDTGRICVVSESHAQIAGRFYNRYFPTLAEIELRRYPDIPAIVESATACGISLLGTEIIEATSAGKVTEDFIQNVAQRNWSMFRLLSEEEFSSGLRALESDLGRCFERASAGATLLWFHKACHFD